MKCKIPNQDAATTMVYIGDVMSGHYEPPGKVIQEDDAGVKYLEVREEIGDILIQEYGYENYEQSDDETESELTNEDEINNDNSN